MGIVSGEEKISGEGAQFIQAFYGSKRAFRNDRTKKESLWGLQRLSMRNQNFYEKLIVEVNDFFAVILSGRGTNSMRLTIESGRLIKRESRDIHCVMCSSGLRSTS